MARNLIRFQPPFLGIRLVVLAALLVPCQCGAPPSLLSRRVEEEVGVAHLTPRPQWRLPPLNSPRQVSRVQLLPTLPDCKGSVNSATPQQMGTANMTHSMFMFTGRPGEELDSGCNQMTLGMASASVYSAEQRQLRQSRKS
eukprot:5255340-Amphidinium_carterae.1